MKIVSLVVVAATLALQSSAFAPPQQPPCHSSSTTLNAKTNHWVAGAVAAIGLTIAPPAFANPQYQQYQQSSVTIAAAPAEPTFEKIDFNMPSYDSVSKSNNGGFGMGSEAFLDGSAEANGRETDKQADAMKKAEEARQKRLVEKKAEAKAREEEIRARAKEKKQRDADRLKGIFD